MDECVVIVRYSIGGRMNELAQLHCSPIKADTPRLNEGEVSQLIAKLPGWRIYEKEGEPRLEKAFQFKNFIQAVAFTDQVAQAADQEDHHPAILTEWGKVTVTWWTHRIKGLHQNDFIMAAKTEQLYGVDF
jgi:4a-hydroxytetrahydrobiopterin dehydratase